MEVSFGVGDDERCAVGVESLQTSRVARTPARLRCSWIVFSDSSMEEP